METVTVNDNIDGVELILANTSRKIHSTKYLRKSLNCLLLNSD
jgi:hypothetical protein